jgi:hypothetical protein
MQFLLPVLAGNCHLQAKTSLIWTLDITIRMQCLSGISVLETMYFKLHETRADGQRCKTNMHYQRYFQYSNYWYCLTLTVSCQNQKWQQIANNTLLLYVSRTCDTTWRNSVISFHDWLVLSGHTQAVHTEDFLVLFYAFERILPHYRKICHKCILLHPSPLIYCY